MWLGPRDETGCSEERDSALPPRAPAGVRGSVGNYPESGTEAERFISVLLEGKLGVREVEYSVLVTSSKRERLDKKGFQIPYMSELEPGEAPKLGVESWLRYLRAR